MANECIPLYRPGADITVQVTAAVIGCTFVDISATRDVTTGLIKVATAAAASKAFGVAVKDQPVIGERVPIINGPGTIVPVMFGGAVTAGAEVEVGASGRAVVLAAGKAVGKAIETGANNVVSFIELY